MEFMWEDVLGSPSPLACLVGHLHSSMMGPRRKYSHIVGFFETKSKIGSNLDFETNVTKVH
jgi:hypothetical protein